MPDMPLVGNFNRDDLGWAELGLPDAVGLEGFLSSMGELNQATSNEDGTGYAHLHGNVLVRVELLLGWIAVGNKEYESDGNGWWAGLDRDHEILLDLALRPQSSAARTLRVLAAMREGQSLVEWARSKLPDLWPVLVQEEGQDKLEVRLP